MALAGNAFMALVVNFCALKTDKRDHAAQKEIDFVEVCKFLQNPRADQAVVSMVVDNFGTHLVEELVETLGSEALEEGVGRAFGAYAVDDFSSV